MALTSRWLRLDVHQGSPETSRLTHVAVDAVIFDWGGTLTRWHDIDFHAESLALAQAVVNATTPTSIEVDVLGPRLHAAGNTIWGRSPRPPAERHGRRPVRPRPASTTTPTLLAAYYDFWEPHTYDRPGGAAAVGGAARAGASRSACSPTRSGRAPGTSGFFERDGVLDLIDGDVYTERDPVDQAVTGGLRGRRWRRSALSEPARCVYVGDRLFDDVWGARNAGLRAIHIPHSTIPADQVGHTEGDPDAVVHRLVRDRRSWSATGD